MDDYSVGEYIIYRNGDRYELGRIKSLQGDGAFVAYHEGETSAKTPWDCMHKLINAYCIKDTTLGGECFKHGQYEINDEELIRRSDVIEITAETGALETQRRVKALPAIEPKRGEWVWQSSTTGSFTERRYKCSNCQYGVVTQREEPRYNFCPNCGARMKGTDDEV